MEKDEELKVLARLLTGQRWAALATVTDDGSPYSSQVAFAMQPDFGAALLHLSGLAAHTKHLRCRPQVSLSITEPDDGRDDPQTLARVSLQGKVEVLDKESDEYAAGRARYLEKLPAAEPRFGFADFQLFRLNIEQARFVGGFARARTFGAEALKRAAPL